MAEGSNPSRLFLFLFFAFASGSNLSTLIYTYLRSGPGAERRRNNSSAAAAAVEAAIIARGGGGGGDERSTCGLVVAECSNPSRSFLFLFLSFDTLGENYLPVR